MKCPECGLPETWQPWSSGAVPCQSCERRRQAEGAPPPLTEWVIKKTCRLIATQAAVEAARRRIHGD